MATKVRMPRLTYEMREAHVIAWLKSEGEMVELGDDLFEVETDKAAVTVQAEAAGLLRGIRFQAGQVAPVGELLAYIAEAGEETPPLDAAAAVALGPEAASPRLAAAVPTGGGVDGSLGRDAGERVLVSPIAKRLARQHGIDLSTIRGTGPGGRIREADIEGELAHRAQAAEPHYSDLELSRLQRVTGERLSACQREVPQFVLELQVDMGAAAALRGRCEGEQGYRPSYTSIIARAVALALTEHPHLNSAFVDGKRRVFSRVNLGIAVALPEGLVVPVIRDADKLALTPLDERLRELTRRAGAGELCAEDLADGTFTISNLGVYGVDAFQAIVNPPQAAILAVGRIRDVVAARDGMISVRPAATLRLTIDHRVADGVEGARLLGRIRGLLESAEGWL